MFFANIMNIQFNVINVLPDCMRRTIIDIASGSMSHFPPRFRTCSHITLVRGHRPAASTMFGSEPTDRSNSTAATFLLTAAHWNREKLNIFSFISGLLCCNLVISSKQKIDLSVNDIYTTQNNLRVSLF